MSDMGDDFRAMREHRKERRAQSLSRAEKRDWPVQWTVHTEYHWSCTLAGKRLDYWPSGGKFQYEGRVHIGGIHGFIKKRLKG